MFHSCHGGVPADLIASIKGRLSRYPNDSDRIVVFDKYQGVSAKDHKRKRRAGEVVIDYELSITCSLPKRDTILKSKNNKQSLASVLSTFSVGENVIMETKDDGAFCHDEADVVTMVSYVIQAANYGKNVIRVLSDDTDVFVLLLYWVEQHCSARCRWSDGMAQFWILTQHALNLAQRVYNCLVCMLSVGVIPPHIYMAKARQEHSTPCFLGTYLVWQMPWVRLTSLQLI